MVRVKRGNVARNRRKKIFKYTKGFKSTNSRCFRVANQQYKKGLNNAYKGRKQRKRLMRRQWIVQINALAKQKKTNYSRFISSLKKQQIGLNRKILAILAFYKPIVFDCFILS